MEHDFNWTVWFWAIICTVGIVMGISKFDTEHFLMCFIILTPVILFDIYLIRECILEIKQMINKRK